jgi:hypothetical protein
LQAAIFHIAKRQISANSSDPDRLLGYDRSEKAICVVGTGGEEKLVRLTIAGRPSTKLNPP